MNEITLRIKKAEKLLKDAENELEMGMHERCCSTAYYAMFHAAKAMILSIGDDSRTHRGTIYLIWKNRERLGLNKISEKTAKSVLENLFQAVFNF